MLEKVIVMELKEDYAVVLCQGGGMLRIKRKNGMQVGDRIYVLPEDLYAPAEAKAAGTHKKTVFWKPLLSAAAMIALIAAVLLQGVGPTAYAVVSFNGAQALQLEVDQDYRIVSGSACGDEALQEEIQGLKGRELTTLGGELGDLLGKGPLLIGYASYCDNDTWEEWAEQQLRRMFSSQTVLYLKGTGEDISSAEAGKLSLGRYLAGQIISEEDQDRIDDLVEDYEEYLEELEEQKTGDHDDDDDETKDVDLSALEDLSLNEIMEELRQHPEYQTNEDFMELLADKVEDAHEAYQEKEEDDADDEEDNEEEDQDDE